MEKDKKIVKTDEEWRRKLSPEQYDILRRKGTERAFTGKYFGEKAEGMYLCAACGQELFSSDAKYDSGTGWPSFYAPVKDENVELAEDRSLGMKRTEVACSRCGGHLGHAFDDGPLPDSRVRYKIGSKPTGKRYCINSAALELKENKGT